MTKGRKHIVFDWNSTLLDDFPIIHECMNYIMENLGKPCITIDQFRACYEVPFEKLYLNLGFEETTLNRIMDFNKRTFHDYYEPKAVNAPLRDGAADLLQHLREQGLSSYILSNHLVEPIRTQLSRLGIDHLFDEVLAYANRETQFVDMSKGERLRRYRAVNDIAPEDTLIIGDSVEEIEIAREQKLTSVAITGGGALEERLRKEEPDYVIHSLRELQPILAERGFL